MSTVKCSLHPLEDLKIICTEKACCKLICKSCAKEEHNNHQYQYITEYVNHVQTLADKETKLIDKISKTLKAYKEKTHKMAAFVDTKFGLGDEVLNDLSEIFKEKIINGIWKEFTTQRNKLREKINQVEDEINVKDFIMERRRLLVQTVNLDINTYTKKKQKFKEFYAKTEELEKTIQNSISPSNIIRKIEEMCESIQNLFRFKSDLQVRFQFALSIIENNEITNSQINKIKKYISNMKLRGSLNKSAKSDIFRGMRTEESNTDTSVEGGCRRKGNGIGEKYAPVLTGASRIGNKYEPYKTPKFPTKCNNTPIVEVVENMNRVKINHPEYIEYFKSQELYSISLPPVCPITPRAYPLESRETPAKQFSTVFAGNMIYICGGVNHSLSDSAYSKETYLLKKESGELMRKEDMHIGKWRSPLLFVPPQTIYSIGGITESISPTNICEEYSVLANSWTLMRSLNISENILPNIIYIGEYIYILGGANHSHTPITTIERLDLREKGKGWEIVNVEYRDPNIRWGVWAGCYPLDSNNILIFGGVNKQGLLNTAFSLFNTNTFTLHNCGRMEYGGGIFAGSGSIRISQGILYAVTLRGSKLYICDLNLMQWLQPIDL